MKGVTAILKMGDEKKDEESKNKPTMEPAHPVTKSLIKK